MKDNAIILTFLLCSFLTLSQTDKITVKLDTLMAENEYFNPLSDKISIRANLSSNIKFYKFRDSEASLSLEPNNNLRTSLTVDYKFIGFSLGFAPKFFPGNNDNELKGKSQLSGIGFQFNFRRWLQKVGYEKVSGFYVKNTRDFIPNWSEGEDPYIQIPALSTKTFSGSTAYKFNDNFSFSAVNGYFQWQLKSAGSFIPTFDYDYTIFKLKADQTLDNIENTSNEFNLTLKTSYYHTFVFRKNWLLSFTGSPGIGLNFARETDKNFDANTTTKENSNYAYYVLDGSIVLGYNSKTFYSGARYDWKNLSNFDKNQESLSVVNNFFEFYIGYHFDAPNFIKKPFNWFENKTNL